MLCDGILRSDLVEPRFNLFQSCVFLEGLCFFCQGAGSVLGWDHFGSIWGSWFIEGISGVVHQIYHVVGTGVWRADIYRSCSEIDISSLASWIVSLELVAYSRSGFGLLCFCHLPSSSFLSCHFLSPLLVSQCPLKPRNVLGEWHLLSLIASVVLQQESPSGTVVLYTSHRGGFNTPSSHPEILD